ncbi:MAG TPA: alanine/glycine:cation symporter family protein [Pirellulaceae bacterium]|nr:alanine/glycine:cation symporter family protein [Pirellulaceae bacterium]
MAMGIGSLMLAMLLAAGSVAQDEPTSSDSAPPAATATEPAPSTPGDAAAADSSAADSGTPETPTAEASATDTPATAAAAATPAADWYAQVDSAFKVYLLDPLNYVLFNSFGSEYLFGRKIPFVVAWLLVAACFLTLRMSFVNLRYFWHAIRLTKGDYDDKNDVGEVSHFQALASALSATVGLGNIAGVALAVGAGGPGAIFWMVLIGLLGMTSKFTECTLGQLYRKVNHDGTITGGAMHYLRDGLKEKGLGALGSFLAILFSILCILASFGGGNSYQVGQSLDVIREAAPILQEGQHPVIYGLIMAFLAGLVIIGGIKSIGRVASIIVPFMCVAYVGMALYILITNAAEVPQAFATIFTNAWSMKAGLGGLLGGMVLGIQRAVFSNEAGTGSAAIAHSAAKTDEPVSEGIVALLEPFIDTVLVCTMTGLVVVIAGGTWTPNEQLASLKIGQETTITVQNETGATSEVAQMVDSDYVHAQPLGTWENEAYGPLVAQRAGSSVTMAAVTGPKGLPFFRYILYGAVVLFAFSTIISWSYYGERCWTSLFGQGSSMVYKILFLVFTVLGSIVTKGNILDFSDTLILGMSFPNLLGLYILSGRVKRELDTYGDKLKRGEIKPNA